MRQAQRTNIQSQEISPVNPWDFTLSFITSFDRVMEHHHNAYKVTVSMDKMVDFEINGIRYAGGRGYIMNQNVKHTCAAKGATVLVNFIETHSFLGWQIKTLLGDRPFMNISELLDNDAINHVLPADFNDMAEHELIPHVNAFLRLLLEKGSSIPQSKLDERIVSVLKYVHTNLHQQTSLSEIASRLNVSPGRLRHLFAEQMGIPFSQYVLWKRIRITLTMAVVNQISLTESCHRFGFSDQPHFNKVFRRVFGMNPMMLINHARMLL